LIDQYKTLSEKFIKKGFWLYLFSFIIAPIWYIIKIIISHNISISDLWILYWIISLITLLSSFNDFWMTESLNYFIPKYFIKNNYSKIKTIISYAFLTQITTWILIALFLYFWADFLAKYYFKSSEAKVILQFFCLYFLWINIFQVFNKFFLTVQNTFYNKLTDFLRMLFIMAFTIYITFLNLWDLKHYAIWWILGLYFGIIFVLYFFYTKYYKIYFKWIPFTFSKKLFNQLFSYAIVVFLAAQAWTILSQIDMQMIIYLLWTKEAGYYTNYLSIISIPFMIIWPIFWLLFPVFSELYAKKDFNKIKLTKKIMQKNFIAIAIAFNILFFIFGPTIAYILFWEKYITSWEILRYSIIFLVFNFLLQINFNILAWIWKVKERLKIISLAIIMNTILNIIFIKYLWVYWAALATAFWWVFIWIISELKLWKKYFTKFDYKFLTKNIILMWLLWFILYNFFNLNFFINIWRIYSLWIFSLIWIFWFWFFLILNLNEFKKLITQIKR